MTGSITEAVSKELVDLQEKRGKPFTPTQAAFLIEVMHTNFDLKKAATNTGANLHNMTRMLKDELVELAKSFLLSESDKAISFLVDILGSNKSVPNAAIKLAAAKELLDRAGIFKTDRLEVDATVSTGVFILPSKGEEKLVAIDEKSYASS